MFRDKIKVLGREIKRGESVSLDLDVAKLHSRHSIEVPVFIERAEEDGPVILLMAGVHGDELNGIEILRRLIHNKNNRPKKGTIICMPVLNIFGFIDLSRKFPDGRDLNRVFPGSKKGSLASQFAFKFQSEVLPDVDYAIDFHTGGADRENVAQIRCVFEDKEAFELAKIFNPPCILHSKPIANSIRKTFRQKGKIGLLFEGGKANSFDEETIIAGLRGINRVLAHFEMADKSINDSPNEMVIIKASKWIRAPYSGFFHVKIKNGEMVARKKLMGIITDPFGEFEKKIFAPSAGFVFGLNTTAIVNKGDALFHISTLDCPP